MLKVLFIIGIMIGVFTTIGVLIPDQITAAIDQNIIWLLVQINTADITGGVVLECFRIMFNFVIGLGIFFIIDWFIDKVTK